MVSERETSFCCRTKISSSCDETSFICPWMMYLVQFVFQTPKNFPQKAGLCFGKNCSNFFWRIITSEKPWKKSGKSTIFFWGGGELMGRLPLLSQYAFVIHCNNAQKRRAQPKWHTTSARMKVSATSCQSLSVRRKICFVCLHGLQNSKFSWSTSKIHHLGTSCWPLDQEISHIRGRSLWKMKTWRRKFDW